MINVGNICFRNCILCEDIRQEKSEKFILSGVFPGDILVDKIPAKISIAFYLDTTVTQPGETNLLLRMSGPGEGSVVISANVSSTVENEVGTMALPRMEVSMQSEGVFRLEASADQEGTWTTLIEKNVIRKGGLWSLNPILSEPPSEQPQIDAQETSSPPEPSPPNSPKKRRRS